MNDFKIGQWVEVEMFFVDSAKWDSAKWWRIAGSRYDPESQPYQPLGDSEKISYCLPIIDIYYPVGVLPGLLTLGLPPSNFLFLKNRQISAWVNWEGDYGDARFVRVEFSQVKPLKPEEVNFCPDCGWYCFQQCFKFNKSYHRKIK